MQIKFPLRNRECSAEWEFEYRAIVKYYRIETVWEGSVGGRSKCLSRMRYAKNGIIKGEKKARISTGNSRNASFKPLNPSGTLIDI
jgi:hypothetical protein